MPPIPPAILPTGIPITELYTNISRTEQTQARHAEVESELFGAIERGGVGAPKLTSFATSSFQLGMSDVSFYLWIQQIKQFMKKARELNELAKGGEAA